jgi:hemin uptake protein HemP
MKPLPMPVASVGRIDAPASTAGNQSQRRQIRSDELFSGQREVLIEHAGELYSLRQTSKGKLILTK